MRIKPVVIALGLSAASANAAAFGGMFQGIIENAARDAATSVATDAAKGVARENGVEADGVIDAAAAAHNNGSIAAVQSGNHAIAAQAAADAALAQRQANTPIPTAQLNQFPPSIADLNGDGVVTHGEVQQVQAQRAGIGSVNAADLNRDGIVTEHERIAYQGALATEAAKRNEPAPAAASPLGGLGGMLGGALGGFGR